MLDTLTHRLAEFKGKGLLMTLPPTTNQPTTQSFIGSFVSGTDVPVRYISIRITTLHANWESVVLPDIQDAEWYISYPHFGKKKDNEHFHIFLSGCTNADRERYRKRFKKRGFSGNQHLSIKLCENGVTNAITYGAREGTIPFTKGDQCTKWIAGAPKWVEQRATVKKRKADDFIELTCKNLLKVCFEFHQQEELKTTDLACTMELMLNRGTYIMSPTLMRQGAPIWMLDIFSESVKLGRLKWDHKLWRAGVFRDFSSRC